MTDCVVLRSVQIHWCRAGNGPALETIAVLPSGFTPDRSSFRSLGGSPASAGLPNCGNRAVEFPDVPHEYGL